MIGQVKKLFLNKIAEINEMLPKIKVCDDIPLSYNGSTFPFYIELTKKIEVKNQFVYIFEKEQSYSFGFCKRYNTNKDEGESSRDELLYHLNLIKKTFKAHLKQSKINFR
jgi:hypothetical protein